MCVNAWCAGLKELENVRTRRCYRRGIEIPVDTQLHVFTDASELGFGAVAYLRFVYAGDGVEVAFLMAKTHVAPVKKRTIPELELKGACEGVDLARVIADELQVDYRKVTFHTDSKTVMQWINSKTCKFNVFVGNKIGKIHRETEPEKWRHVKGLVNPALTCRRKWHY